MQRPGKFLKALLVVAMTVWLSEVVPAATVQDFNIPGRGTPYVAIQTNNPPGPTPLPGGPTGSGKFLRLASAQPDPLPPSSNTITFPNTDPPTDMVVVDFDFRITPGNAVTPGRGRADGLGFALLNTTFFTAPGIEPGPPTFAVEEPNFSGSLGIGFDIYKNADPPGEYPPDIGNDNILENFSNTVSIHFDGELLRQIDVTRVVDLAGGQWIHARILVRAGEGFSDVTVILTPRDCQPTTVIRNLPVPGLTPYASRVHFGARSGGETAHHDLDNVQVQFLPLIESVVSLSTVLYTVEETAPTAVVTVMRAGDTDGTVRVQYATANATAVTGADYTATAGLLTLRPGETRKSFTIPILNDRTTERDETFRVFLQHPTEGTVIGGPALATVKIFDDESARTVGHWSPMLCWPIVAVHMHLLPTGQVMLWDRLGNLRLWEPGTQRATIPARPDDNLFCSGHAFFADGQLLVTGGHHRGGAPTHDGLGLPDANVYNPFTNSWTALPNMNDGRWYPTTTTLANGEMLVISGSVDESFTKNPLPQIWRPTLGTWRDLENAAQQQLTFPDPKPLGADLYPWMFLAPHGRVFKAGPDRQTWFLHTAGLGTWSRGPNSRFGLRSYGTAVMYAPGKILIAGGGDLLGSRPDATTTTEVIDLRAERPAWRPVAPMHSARRHLNATLLPDGKVLVTGGTGAPGFNNEARPVRRAELWNPGTETWTTLPAMQVTRGYHSTALLLPDGRVLSAGGGQGSGATSMYNNAEVYLPSYLFKGPRPTITAAPTAVTYGETFVVQTPNAAEVTRVSLLRLPSVTHAFDQNQQFTWLRFSRGRNRLHVTAPAHGNVAPPGYYMLFLLNQRRVPSVATFLQLTADEG